MSAENLELEHLIERTDDEIARYINKSLSETGKKLAIKLYRIGFTLLEPHNYGLTDGNTYSLNVAETPEKAEQLLKEGLEILESYGLEHSGHSIEEPKNESGLYCIKIVVNFEEAQTLTDPLANERQSVLVKLSELI